MEIRVLENIIFEKELFYKKLTEEELLTRLEKSREHAAQGMYKNVEEVVCSMRTKYGL